MALWLVTDRNELSGGILAGGALMLAGTLLEGVADWQKQRSKQNAPDRFYAEGLFTRARHPNYLGEILVQTGLICVAAACAVTLDDFLAGIISPAYIFILMVSEARRVDDYQASRYGSDPAYVAYRERSGSLLPKL
jgi:steroid 5-alpha reductase family enzyme